MKPFLPCDTDKECCGCSMSWTAPPGMAIGSLTVPLSHAPLTVNRPSDVKHMILAAAAAAAAAAAQFSGDHLTVEMRSAGIEPAACWPSFDPVCPGELIVCMEKTALFQHTVTQAACVATLPCHSAIPQAGCCAFPLQHLATSCHSDTSSGTASNAQDLSGSFTLVSSWRWSRGKNQRVPLSKLSDSASKRW